MLLFLGQLEQDISIKFCKKNYQRQPQFKLLPKIARSESGQGSDDYNNPWRHFLFVNLMIRNNPLNFFYSITKRWATNLGGGSTTNGRDSAGKRLGVKMGNGTKCKTGQIIVRQRGFQYYPGVNVLNDEKI